VANEAEVHKTLQNIAYFCIAKQGGRVSFMQVNPCSINCSLNMFFIVHLKIHTYSRPADTIPLSLSTSSRHGGRPWCSLFDPVGGAARAAPDDEADV